MQTYAQTNLQTADYRSTQRPRPVVCEICHEAPAVRRVWHRDARDGSQWTASVCEYCATAADASPLARWRAQGEAEQARITAIMETL